MAYRRTPCITLWQPWATWISLQWKVIETRTHQQFEHLVNHRIGIHAGKRWDPDAIGLASPWLDLQGQHRSEEFRAIRGVIVATARVIAFGRLSAEHSKAALIDCAARTRYGLFLDDIRALSIPATGHQGVWFHDIDDELVDTPQCRSCGCTEECACVIAGQPCHWVEPDLCSACASRSNPSLFR